MSATRRNNVHTEATAELLNHYFEYTRLYSLEIARTIILLHTGCLIAISALTGALYGQGFKFVDAALTQVIRIFNLSASGLMIILFYVTCSYFISHTNLERFMIQVKDYVRSPTDDMEAPLTDRRGKISFSFRIFISMFTLVSFVLFLISLYTFKDIIEGLHNPSNVITRIAQP